MRIIKEPFLRDAAALHPQAASWLFAWIAAVRAASWKNLIEVRKTYPHADAVETASRRTVIVFNVSGNKFRLVAAIHFKSQIVYTLRFLTHAEYSKDFWKNDL